MALLVHWERVAETPTTVTYRFGADPGRMGGSTVIDKVSGQPRGTLLGQATWVVHEVVRERAATGTWPETGVLVA